MAHSSLALWSQMRKMDKILERQQWKMLGCTRVEDVGLVHVCDYAYMWSMFVIVWYCAFLVHRWYGKPHQNFVSFGGVMQEIEKWYEDICILKEIKGCVFVLTFPTQISS